MIIEIHKDINQENWITGETLEEVAEWREGLLMSYNAVSHYISVPKPMLLFPIAQTPENEEGILFDRIFLMDVKKIFGISSISLVNQRFVESCVPKEENPKDFIFKSSEKLRTPYLQKCVDRYGALFIGISTRPRVIAYEKPKDT